MSLRDIPYQEDYRSGRDNILDDFFRTSLSEATVYWRAVGYFSSSALESLGAPLDEFVQRGGTMRLITSVELTPQDFEAIEKGLNRREISERRIEEIIEEQFSEGVGDGVTRLAALLQTGRLEIQIAIPKTKTRTGIYHEKVGVFFDGSGTDYVAFSGSTNESRNAFEFNYECVDVFPSWEAPTRAKRKREHFEELWNRQDTGAEVFSFPEAAAKKLIRTVEESQSMANRGRASGRQDLDTAPTSPTESNKWRHQDEALEKFLQAERGVLNMATGTGKTRTALNIVRTLFERDLIDTVIITTDGKDLLNQWYQQVLNLRKTIRSKPQVFRHYDESKDQQEFNLGPKNAILLVSHEPAANALRGLSAAEAGRTLVIYDEVHGLGSPGNRSRLNGLSDSVRYRIGLSATPERKYDQEGNQFIEAHVGPVLMTFGLEEAIERGILAPFNYYPLSYRISDEDRQRLQRIHAQKAAREASGDPMSKEDVWIKIANVYKTSRAKIPVFQRFIEDYFDLLERCIVFVETKEYGREVLDIIHTHRPDFHTYFSGEDSDTLSRFARGDLECLVTCHRLSEGIDIKSLNTVILFSSEHARLETIQRIGRCLRTNPDAPDKTANIVDFIRINDDPSELNSDEDRRAWLSKLAKVRPVESSKGESKGADNGD